MSVLWWVLLLITVQRLVELAYAQRNTRALFSRGAIEIAAWQHPLFVLLHASWLAAMLAFVPKDTAPVWPIIGVLALLQVARLWIIRSLGPYWTTRIITIPGEPVVRRGPYRFFPHPNYAVVCLEIALVPLAFRAYQLAVVFTILNAVLIAARVRAEESGLRERRSVKT
jgi:methyltransferase